MINIINKALNNKEEMAAMEKTITSPYWQKSIVHAQIISSAEIVICIDKFLNTCLVFIYSSIYGCISIS